MAFNGNILFVCECNVVIYVAKMNGCNEVCVFMMCCVDQRSLAAWLTEINGGHICFSIRGAPSLQIIYGLEIIH